MTAETGGAGTDKSGSASDGASDHDLNGLWSNVQRSFPPITVGIAYGSGVYQQTGYAVRTCVTSAAARSSADKDVCGGMCGDVM